MILKIIHKLLILVPPPISREQNLQHGNSSNLAGPQTTFRDRENTVINGTSKKRGGISLLDLKHCENCKG